MREIRLAFVSKRMLFPAVPNREDRNSVALIAVECDITAAAEPNDQLAYTRVLIAEESPDLGVLAKEVRAIADRFDCPLGRFPVFLR